MYKLNQYPNYQNYWNSIQTVKSFQKCYANYLNITYKNSFHFIKNSFQIISTSILTRNKKSFQEIQNEVT